ncbi:MAG: hypothetical protein HY744_10480 [Deltaproteobacteria bacterium]|nr:hypothetical protein [Deltaproteobacteria bacterium]
MPRSAVPLWLLLLLGSLGACAAPSATASIEEVPVCPDFELGAARTMMKGGLRRPVMVTSLDGSKILSKRLLLGRRTADAPPSKVLVKDSSDTFTIRWAQCANVRAPHPVDAHKSREEAEYSCGIEEMYLESRLVVKKGDAASRVLRFVPPPDPACWTSAVPPAGTATASAAAATAPPIQAERDGGAAASAADAGTPPDGGADAAAQPGAVDAGGKTDAGPGKQRR